jgi:hypothetical protein
LLLLRDRESRLLGHLLLKLRLLLLELRLLLLKLRLLLLKLRLLLLLLLELLLELGRNGRHWRGARCLELLLRLSLSRKSRILLLHRLQRRLVTRRLSLQRVASELLLQWLLQRLLSKARWLRRKGARLLLARLLARPEIVKGAAILLLLRLSPRARTVAS